MAITTVRSLSATVDRTVSPSQPAKDRPTETLIGRSLGELIVHAPDISGLGSGNCCRSNWPVCGPVLSGDPATHCCSRHEACGEGDLHTLDKTPSGTNVTGRKLPKFERSQVWCGMRANLKRRLLSPITLPVYTEMRDRQQHLKPAGWPGAASVPKLARSQGGAARGIDRSVHMRVLTCRLLLSRAVPTRGAAPSGPV
ncbi:hypothetical protein J6590_027615 [Homalodisca vitripennis]|nr:hypothetical protein J6590_027615 [Homalodisca vitripennis]